MAKLFAALPENFDEDPPPRGAERRLHYWQRLIDLRQCLLDRITEGEHGESAELELRRVDEAIVNGGRLAIEQVLKRIRNVRYARAVLLIEELLETIRAKKALTDHRSRISIEYVRGCLLHVGRNEFVRVLEHADIALTLKLRGPREAAFEVVEAASSNCSRTVGRAMQKLREEFELA